MSRFLRSEMIEVLQSDFMLLVKAKGVRKKNLILKHAMRNALIQLLQLLLH